MRRLKRLLVGFFVLLGCFSIPGFALQDIAQEAEQAYQKGEQASTIAERKVAFNQALTLYTQLESQSESVYSTGKLYFNMGNTYYQLAEYSWAIVYYYRALQLMPTSQKVRYNLNMALSKVSASPAEEMSIFQDALFFHFYLSLPERLQWLSYLALLMIIFGSLYLWYGWWGYKYMIIVLAVVWGLLFASVLYSRYVEPINAIVVTPTALYRDAGVQYAKVIEKPILSGRKVQVIEVVDDGKWLKVLSTDGNVGYVPNTAVKII
ncbi:MAG: hypothetical protein H0X51_06915 [Parachlamydiaceae bacterium]|nr:hypothetical protein [Parachlamydiaceae bacterium]